MIMLVMMLKSYNWLLLLVNYLYLLVVLYFYILLFVMRILMLKLLLIRKEDNYFLSSINSVLMFFDGINT